MPGRSGEGPPTPDDLSGSTVLTLADARSADPGRTVARAADRGDGDGSLGYLVVSEAKPRDPRRLPPVVGYELMGEVGRGAVGIVYLARQVRLNRLCALKMVLAGPRARPENLVRFLAEAEAGARLQHPSVVQIYGVGEHDDLPFLELEYLPGGSLEQLLDGRPWAPGKAAGMLEVLADAVGEAHRIGIVHRDLKPSNVLLTADGRPKVADFGLAKALELDGGATASGLVLGSPDYMAPEQAEGRSHAVGPAADVYSLGAILYEMLVGRPPFRASTVLGTLERVKHAEPSPPSRKVPGLPRDLETICLKCLQKDPARRYGSALELAEDIARFRNGEAILARRSGAFERTWRRCRRRPGIAALIGLAAVQSVSIAAGSVALLVMAGRVADLEDRRAACEHCGADRPAAPDEQETASARRRSEGDAVARGRDLADGPPSG